ncbi:MAG: stage III sporulation protein AG [Ruminiclostridium sp.]
MDKFNKILKDLKRKFAKNGSKKLIEKAVIFAIVGVICLIAGSVLFEGNTTKGANGSTLDNINNADTIQTIKQSSEAPKNEMESSLQSILSKIKGAGRVDVMITFFSGNESVPAMDIKTNENDTQEKDKEGGSRIIKQSDIENKTIYEENQGVKKPFIIKEVLPKVKGVVIVADGAEDAEVKINLAKATEALLDIAAHKIQVFQRTGN